MIAAHAATAQDETLVLEGAQTLGERARADPGARVLELGEAACTFGEIVHEEGRPLCADDLRTRCDRT